MAFPTHDGRRTDATSEGVLTAALKLRDRLAGKTVALIASGGNITLSQLREVIA